MRMRHLTRPQSTQLSLLQEIRRDATQVPLSVWTDMQTKGYGTHARIWENAEDSLLFSVAFREPVSGHSLDGIALALMTAIGQNLEELGVDFVFKWPNDILCGGKKLAGLLVERKTVSRETFLLVGVGMNFRCHPRQQAAFAQLCDFTSLPGKEDFLSRILAGLEKAMEKFTLEGFSVFQEDWMRKACWLGEEVHIMDGSLGSPTGIFLGVDGNGRALVRTRLGTEALSSGSLGEVRP